MATRRLPAHRRRRSRQHTGRMLAALVCCVLATLLLPAAVGSLAHPNGTQETPAAQSPTQTPTQTAQAESVQESLRQLAATTPIRVYDADADEVVCMGLELYTLLVTGAEMPVSYEAEALKAQTVAARTLAINKAARGGCASGRADVCTRYDSCQAYRSLESYRAGWGAEFDANMQKLIQAVQATEGEVLTYDGEPIITFFHSTSGGYTEAVQNVFSQTLPYYQVVQSPGEEWAPRYTGEMTLSRTELVQKVNAAHPTAKLSAGSLESQLQILARTDSGRVDRIQLGGVCLRGTQLRALLGLNSTNFTLAFEENRVRFCTKGYGHGVGMSQTGADAMAMRGAGYREILHHYYVDTQIQSVQQLGNLL